MENFKTKKEQKIDIIKDIKSLKKRGATFQEITDKFNNDGLTTVYNKKWSLSSLNKFYNKYK